MQGETYNIILEFADQGTLEEYFHKTGPPARGEDIMDFWKGMFETIKALQCIHQAGGKGPNEGPQILHGYYNLKPPSTSFVMLLMSPRFHQDVKPANILVVSNQESSDPESSRYKWKFKVADLGLSHFERVVGKQESVTANDAHGTRTYGLYINPKD
jgi:serine/threonine protein kinase